MLKNVKKKPLLANKKFVFFFTWELLLKKFVCRFVFKKFVKTYHELVKRFKICGICSKYFQSNCQRWSKVCSSYASIWLGVKLLEISRKCSNWSWISKLSSNFGCLFTFCYLDGANSIKTDLCICNLWTGQFVRYKSAI